MVGSLFFTRRSNIFTCSAIKRQAAKMQHLQQDHGKPASLSQEAFFLVTVMMLKSKSPECEAEGVSPKGPLVGTSHWPSITTHSCLEH